MSSDQEIYCLFFTNHYIHCIRVIQRQNFNSNNLGVLIKVLNLWLSLSRSGSSSVNKINLVLLTLSQRATNALHIYEKQQLCIIYQKLPIVYIQDVLLPVFYHWCNKSYIQLSRVQTGMFSFIFYQYRYLICFI